MLVSHFVQAVTTKDGQLVITLTEEDSHNLNFKSGKRLVEFSPSFVLKSCRHVTIMEQALFHDRIHRGSRQPSWNGQFSRFLAWSLDNGQSG